MITKEDDINIKSLRERYLVHELNIINALCAPGTHIQNVVYTPYMDNKKYDLSWEEITQIGNIRVKNKVIAEIKIRNYPMIYPTWTIEKDKYQFLINTRNDKKLYINIYPDGVRVWDLKKLSEPIWEERILPKDNFNQDNKKIKIKGELLSSEAILIIKKDVNIEQAYIQCAELHKKRQNKKK